MFCKRCGNKLVSGELYCPNCGRKIDIENDEQREKRSYVNFVGKSKNVNGNVFCFK